MNKADEFVQNFTVAIAMFCDENNISDTKEVDYLEDELTNAVYTGLESARDRSNKRILDE